MYELGYSLEERIEELKYSKSSLEATLTIASERLRTCRSSVESTDSEEAEGSRGAGRRRARGSGVSGGAARDLRHTIVQLVHYCKMWVETKPRHIMTKVNQCSTTPNDFIYCKVRIYSLFMSIIR